MEHCVDAPDVGATEAGILLLLRFTYPAVVFEVVVQLLDGTGCQLVQLDAANLWDDVVVDEALVVGRCGWPDVGFCVDLEPSLHPLAHCVLLRADDVQLASHLDSLLYVSLTSAWVLPRTFFVIRLPVVGS